MSLSKPIVTALGLYLEQLFVNPVKTKAITGCVIATAGNYASQLIEGGKVVNKQSLFAYGLYGLLFAGTVPHYFYKLLEIVISEDTAFPVVKKLFIERLIYSPIYQAFALYMIARFEGRNHAETLQQLHKLYWPILRSSWKYLTLLHLANLSLVPPVLRVFFINFIGFFWVIYLSHKRRQAQQAGRK